MLRLSPDRATDGQTHNQKLVFLALVACYRQRHKFLMMDMSNG